MGNNMWGFEKNERWSELIKRIREGHKLSKKEFSRHMVVEHNDENWKQLESGVIPNDYLIMMEDKFCISSKVLEWYQNRDEEEWQAADGMFLKIDKLMSNYVDRYFKDHDFSVIGEFRTREVRRV